MNEIYIHNFERKQDLRGSVTYAPSLGFGSLVDVRGGDGGGASLFYWRGEGPIPSEARLIAGGPDDTLTEANAAILTSALRLTRPLPAVRFADVLTHILTTHADPRGQDAPRPLTYDHRGGMEVLIHGARVWRRRFDPADPFCAATLDLLRREWRKLKSRSHANAEALAAMGATSERIEKARNLHRRWLGSFEREARFPAAWITQSGEAEDAPLRPETTLTDDFTHADGADIGNLLTWNEFTTGSPDSSTWETVSNQASNQNAASVYARSDSALSSANHYAFINVHTFNHVGGEDMAGATARDDTSGADHYVAGLFYDGADKIRFAKYISGTLTALDSDQAAAHSVPDKIEIECDGSTMSSSFNGVGVHSFTDTSLATGTFCGFFGTTGMGGSGDLKFDDFEAGDLAVAATPPPPQPGTRGMSSRFAARDKELRAAYRAARRRPYYRLAYATGDSANPPPRFNHPAHIHITRR